MSNSPSEYPTALELTSDSHLRITWNDDSESQIAFAVLRKHCPCAHCRVDARKPKPVELLPVISAAEAQPLLIESMKPLGNYAYVIAFSDGHNSGIYEFTLLRKLGQASATS
jgi:DUF971 family protein